jgi:hypothetical protein
MFRQEHGFHPLPQHCNHDKLTVATVLSNSVPSLHPSLDPTYGRALTMKLAAFVLTLLVLLTSVQSPAQSPLIGIFEGASSGKGDGPGQPGVRVLFYQSGLQWRSYNAICKDEACLRTITHLFPHTTTWNLIRSGKPIAKVTAETPQVYHFYSEIGVQAITNPGKLINLEPRPSPERPDLPHTILATNLSTLTDPDNWQPAATFPLDLTRLQHAFRKAFPHPNNCTTRQVIGSQPWNYADSDIKLNATYLSNKGWRLAQLTLDGYLCDGPPDAAFLDQWFALSPNNEIHHIGGLMHLAGAADFAHNGRTELLFQKQDSNNGGYKLFFDNFTHTAQATVTHH